MSPNISGVGSVSSGATNVADTKSVGLEEADIPKNIDDLARIVVSQAEELKLCRQEIESWKAKVEVAEKRLGEHKAKLAEQKKELEDNHRRIDEAHRREDQTWGEVCRTKGDLEDLACRVRRNHSQCR